MTSTLKLHNDLFNAFSLDGLGGAHHVNAKDVPAWTPKAGNLWVHLNYSNPEDVLWLSGSSGLDPLIVEALLTEETRPRTAALGGGLLITLRGVNLNPHSDPEDMISIRVWIDESRIITCRKRDLISVDDLVHQFNTHQGPYNCAGFLVELVDRIIWRMNDTVEQFEDKVAEFEEQVLAVAGSSLRSELTSLRRQAITIRRYLAPQREALTKLINERMSWLDEESRRRLREVGDRLVRYIEDIDSVRERAALIQEELQSQLAEQMNSRMYVLSVVAAIFLPLGFLTGLVGVNLGGVPGTENAQGFIVFTGVLVAVVIIQIVVFRWKKWM
jgi:zinc transporter